MRRVGGGYFLIQGRMTRTQTCSKNNNEKNELARLRQENESLKKEIESLKAERFQSESAFACQTQALQIMAESNRTLQSQPTNVEGEAAHQKACVVQLLLELETAASEHEVSKKLLEKAQAKLKEAVALTTDYRIQLKKLSNERKMAQLQQGALSPIQPLKSEAKRPVEELDGDDAASFLKNMNKALQNENRGL
uniref:AlNc14C366G11055 protein n=1 Tax=Albugo laibachii Nc14 TaxID=890382 RepID=F0WXX0_9STRA|nr:AlNc14C366G11055 [Albugo laibachii Nc14]|eukprot:CCA26318.1 AlNc14C366G11055 [Albugo laibachii Nc14]